MTKRAEMETKVTGTDQAARNLGDLENAYDRLEKKTKSLWASVRDLQKEWSKPTSAGAAFAKAGAQIIGSQISQMGSAITAPAKTTYDQALQKAFEYRDATQRIATSTGQTYESTNTAIMGTAKRLALLPAQVQSYSSAVREMTGDWKGALDGIDAYQNRALQTGTTLDKYAAFSGMMDRTFGVKATDQVNKFFGTMDAQARAAGVSVERAQEGFSSAAQAFAMFSNAKPGQISALSTSLMAGAPTPEIGQSRMGAAGGFLQQHVRYLEARMRARGQLGKGEHLYDEQGRWRAEKIPQALDFAFGKGGDMSKFYGTKDKMELIGRIAQSGQMSMTDAAGLVNLDPKLLRSVTGANGGVSGAAQNWVMSAAGQRSAADVNKTMKDIGLGSTFLPAQDAAVAAGGGAAGIALSSAGEVFSRATDAFGKSVEIFAAAAGKGGSGGAAAGAAGAGIGSKLAGGVSLVGGAIGGLVGLGITSAAEARADDGDRRRAQGYRQWLRTHHLGVVADGFGGPDDSDLAKRENKSVGGIPTAGVGVEPLAAALTKALAGQTLRVQSVTPAAPPAGQAQPL